MASPTHHPQTPAEKLIARAIGATWLLWLIGGLYIAGPVIGWVLAAMLCWDYYLGRSNRRVPVAIWLWIGGMAALLLILWAGHSNFSLGTGATIKSSIGWAKGWALLALF
ncbi:MAG: O-antigen ligase domain-containing protein, partial [Novosphingopyxis baekryungensis]|nr:O-antigen ligase domain-containing protein [Novosphingopyxis baekryungensis]